MPERDVVDVVIMGARGRMGNTLATLAKADPGLRLAAVVEKAGNEEGLSALGCVVSTDLAALLPGLPGAVVVDFTTPACSVGVAATCAATGNPVVIGTTGLTPEDRRAVEEAAARTPIFWAPNMSLGVNTLLRVLPRLVELLGEAYNIEIMEIHHNRKADSPSGTAIKLGQCLAEARGQNYDAVKKHARDGIIGPRAGEEIGVAALRGGDVVGDHTIYFLGPGERIEVTHRAHSRENFARGALRAAKWLSGQKPGKLYSMADMLS